MIVLDTSVISELARPAADPAVVAWADAQMFDALHTTSVSQAEMLFGIGILPAGRCREALHRAVVITFDSLLAGRVLPFDSAAATAFAEWADACRKGGKSIGLADLQIAAIARARGAASIATRNVRDFEGCGVALVDPWTHAGASS